MRLPIRTVLWLTPDFVIIAVNCIAIARVANHFHCGAIAIRTIFSNGPEMAIEQLTAID